MQPLNHKHHMEKRVRKMPKRRSSRKKPWLSYALVSWGQWHAEDGMDEDDGDDEDDEVCGFIQYARVSRLPFLLEQLVSH